MGLFPFFNLIQELWVDAMVNVELCRPPVCYGSVWSTYEYTADLVATQQMGYRRLQSTLLPPFEPSQSHAVRLNKQTIS